MALIDLTYFIGEINIAGTSRQEIADVVNHMIDKYEIKFLRDVLGIKLYNEYKQLASQPDHLIRNG
jgi:hypothetical protein